MERAEKKEFVTKVLDDTKENILTNIDRMPEEWDGFELRQYIVDYIQRQYAYRRMGRARMREYNNTIAVDGLL